MDTSEKYIEMCRVAEEIQKLKPPEEDIQTHFYCTEHNRFLEYNSELEYQWCGDWRDWHGSDDEERVIWLPRQDQLQEMITNDEYLYRTEFGNSSGALFEAITEFAHRGDCGKSFEMLWLIFVMERKFKKFWDGAAWRALP